MISILASTLIILVTRLIDDVDLKKEYNFNFKFTIKQIMVMATVTIALTCLIIL